MFEVIMIIIVLLLISNLIIIFKVFTQFRQSDWQYVLTSLSNLEKELTKIESIFREELSRNREEMSRGAKDLREELFNKQAQFFQITEQRLERMRDTIDIKLKEIQEDNNIKLEKIRQTVEDRLQRTLNERLGESFKLVSERLEQVYKGLGEIQSLASGVNDLKKVLSNVKMRGSLGEYRLEMLLEQILTSEQYLKNVPIKSGNRERVDFAIKIPSKDNENGFILLPIDSKFPQESYQRLLEAYESGDPILIEEAIKELEKTVKGLAKTIKEKYIYPPETTDFAIMFLPFEGLYAEVVKRPALFETLQREFKVTIVGPTTLSAFLHSLQMGFRTLAIQKRSQEVWSLLSTVKTEFGKFVTLLESVKSNLRTATHKLEEVTKKTQVIEQKLQHVESLPDNETMKLLESEP
ncbi:MAG: DNA recombination protein RmuC [Thermodesulfobacteriaceae bacterium]|nr:DNA recombination protein RmuC [Thermodesulfobacteriaceae bacterium]MCX8041821.1 DNA recombination protein RmuC [Thermodesulfobacteriaceae bacterium]MDW8135292.1 DNA recombination protein RmuC [Thermodesulfobacterium sp.]